jgi:CRP/FNR family cyclic AMP-dependent transcriptional regulator
VSLNEEVELLRNIPLFANIEPSKLKLLAFTSERVAYEPGQELFHQGDDGDAAYIIIGGEADIIIETESGPFKVETLVISKELFYRLILEFPQIAVEIMRELAQRLERMNAQLRELQAAK